MNFEEAFDTFRLHMVPYGRTTVTFYDYASDFRRFCHSQMTTYGCSWQVEHAKPKDIYDYLTGLIEEKSPATINRKRDCLSSIYAALEFVGVVSQNPVQGIKHFKVKTRERYYLSEDVALQFFKTLTDETVGLAARTLFYTGMRAEELVHICNGHFDFETKTVLLQTKGRKEIRTPLHEEKLVPYLRAHMKKYRIEKNPYERFFQTSRTGRISGSTLNKAFGTASEKMGLSHKVTCHIFRHSFATNYIYNGGHLHELQKLLGHDDLATTGKYLHVDLRQIVQRINRM